MERDNVWEMFNRISPTYDRVNRILSCGLDQRWRRQIAKYLPQGKIDLIDCATGTCDQIIALKGHIGKVVGIDLAADMLAIGQNKIKDFPATLKVASALEIPYLDHTFDCATISFGIRNVTNVKKCLLEMRRVLKKGGRSLILEFSLPHNRLIRWGHLFYLRKCLPYIGGKLSKNPQAYAYLNQTIETFPYGEQFCELMRDAGYVNVKAHPLTFGTATIYTGDKPHG